MIALYALIAGGAAAAAIVAVVAFARGTTGDGKRRKATLAQQWARLTRRPAGEAGRRRDYLVIAAAAAGVVCYFLTGWLVAIPAIPAAVLFLPRVIGQQANTDIELLEALDRWVRQIATILPSGSTDVLGSIRISRATAPPMIAEEVATLVARIDAGVVAEDALYSFSDDLDSAEADPIIASLIIAASHTNGITANLNSIADTIQARLGALRSIETERAKPRNTARWVTGLSLAMVAGAAVFGRGYFQPYTTWYGQLVLIALTLAYIASLWWMHRITVPRRRARILITPDRAGATR